MLCGWDRACQHTVTRSTVRSAVQDRGDLMEAMIAHLGTTSIAETLVRLIGADETPSGGAASSQQLLWLERTDIMSNLLSR